MKAMPPAFEGAELLLGRATPRGEARITGLTAAFADLNGLAKYLEQQGLDGYLALVNSDAQPEAMALVFEGGLIGANALGESGPAWGEGALNLMTHRYAQDGTLGFFKLERSLVHALSGLGGRVLKVQPGDFFTGVRAHGDGRITLLAEGAVIGRLNAGLRENGTYPAALRPARLVLPRVLGAWATERYTFTLRGRDAINPITDQYNRARAAHGKMALELLARLGRGQTPLESAATLERDVTELEPLVETFLREGWLRRRQDPTT